MSLIMIAPGITSGDDDVRSLSTIDAGRDGSKDL